VKGDFAGDTQAAIKIHQVDAAAEEKVLAVVYRLSVDFVRGSAAAQEGAGFEEFHGMACGSKCSGRG
jgi:hypothetical protein